MKKVSNIIRQTVINAARTPGKRGATNFCPRSWLRLLLLAFCSLHSGLNTTFGQTTNSPSRLDYSSFRIIADRNIFNPRRSGRSTYTPRSQRPTSQMDSFALVGTMSYEKGPFAFFEGSSSEFRKVLKQDESIAGFKVAAIEPSRVKLASPTNEIDLPVGMQLRHEDDGAWHLSARTETAPSAPSRYASSGAGRGSFQSRSGVTNTRFSTNTIAGTNITADAEQAATLAEPQEGTPNSAPAPTPEAGGGDDILTRLRQRAAAERGEAPQ